MSHEIRTPMNGILGFLSLLREPELSDDSKLKYIDIVYKSGQRLLNTINDIIEISKIDAGEHQLYQAEVNIFELLNYYYEFFYQQAEFKKLGLRLNNQIEPEDNLVYTDKSKLESILTNLIKNAIKFTSEGYVEFGCLMQSGLYIFYVKDTGIGIPYEQHGAVFERFVQAHRESNRLFEGSGLGLSIVKEYVHMLGGEIWFESIPGKGSSFYVSFGF